MFERVVLKIGVVGLNFGFVGGGVVSSGVPGWWERSAFYGPVE